MRALVCLLCALALAGGTAEAQFAAPSSSVPAEQFNTEIGLMFWTPSPDLVITSSAFAPLGGTVDFVNTFAIEDKRFVEYRFLVKPGRKHKLRFSKVKFSYQEEDAVVQGAPAGTDITWELWRGGYEYDLISRGHGFIGVVTELKYNKVNASVSSGFGASAVEQTVAVPTVGGIARGYLGDYISLTGELTFMSITRDTYRGKFYDLDLYGTAHLGKSVGVQVGYRRVTTDYLVDDDEGDLEMKGMYFGGLVRF